MAGFFASGALSPMRPDLTRIAGVVCAVAAIGLIAWMCFQSWGGVSPF